MAETTDPANAGQAAASPGTGEMLRQAREAKGLTIQQVAQSLHLDAWILEALEDNRFRDIGAPVFVKGHLRKFASEVGVSQESVMDAYYQSENTPETPELVTDTLTRPTGDSRSRGPVLALSLVLVALIALVAWLWLREQGFMGSDAAGAGNSGELVPAAGDTRLAAPGEGTAGPAEAVPIATLPGPATVDSTGADSAGNDADMTDASAESTNAANAGTPAVPSEPAQTPPAEGTLRLSIDFANDSWVEIYDGGNRRLFFDLGKAGTRRTVSGEPPLQVLLGNAEGARITLNGEAYEIPAGARRGKTARFTVQ